MTRARLSLILIVLAGALALVAGSALGAGAQRASLSLAAGRDRR